MNRNHSFVRLRRKAKNNLDKNAITEKYIKPITPIENKNQDSNQLNQINDYNYKKSNSNNYTTTNKNNPLHSKYNRINSNNNKDNYININTNYNNNTQKVNQILRPSKSAIYSKSSNRDSHNHENSDDVGDYYLCQNCINEKLIEEKRKRNEFNSRNNDNINDLFEDKNKYYDENRIKKKLNQREKNILEVYHTLEKCQQSNLKDKLIKENESAPNPLLQHNYNYLYENFRTKYAQKQQYIKENYNKFVNKERPEITQYFNNYINNPNYRPREYGEYKPKVLDIDNYKKDLNEQINYKINKKRREKEEDKLNENREYLAAQEKIKKENEEKALKKQKIKEELIKGNLDIINAKKDKKIKILEEDMKYKQYYEKENQEYNNKLLKEKCKKSKINREFVTENQKNLNKIRRDKEQQKIDNNNYRYNDYSYEPKKELTDKCYVCNKVYPKKLLTRNSNIFGYKKRIKK